MDPSKSAATKAAFVDGSAVIRAEDANHCVATWKRTLIVIWRLEPTAAAAEEVNKICLGLLAEARSPLSALLIVEGSSPMPGAEARQVFARFGHDIVPKMAMAAVVPEGGGFRTASVRGVLTALTFIMPHRVPYQFAANVDEAARCLAPHLSLDSGGADGLRRAVTGLRARLAGTSSLRS